MKMREKSGKFIYKLNNLIHPITDIAFPPVCACCGLLLINRDDVICEQCIGIRFERDIDDDQLILPESVSFRFSLWRFDKMGYLQDLLHKLKYDHLTGIGSRLGKELGKQLISRSIVSVNAKNPFLIVPVPLHKKRYRKRGYNQSREIGKGISASSQFELIPEDVVRRPKNTRTQTGLDSGERLRNLEGAFQINTPDYLQGRKTIIVDDVYTTGATTFELAGCLYEHTGNPSGIVTIART